jgi:hypothetical protein
VSQSTFLFNCALVFASGLIGCQRTLPVVYDEPLMAAGSGAASSSVSNAGRSSAPAPIAPTPAGRGGAGVISSNAGAPASAPSSPSTSSTAAGACPDFRTLKAGDSSGEEPIDGHGTATLVVGGVTTQPAVRTCRIMRNTMGEMVAYFVRTDTDVLTVPSPTHGDWVPYHGDGQYESFDFNDDFLAPVGTVTISNNGAHGVAEYHEGRSSDPIRLEWSCDPAITIDPIERKAVGLPPPGSAYFVPDTGRAQNMVFWFDHVACEHISNFAVMAPGSNECNSASGCSIRFNIDFTSFKRPLMPGKTSAGRLDLGYYGVQRGLGIRGDLFVDAEIACDQTLHGMLSGSDGYGAFNCPIQ